MSEKDEIINITLDNGKYQVIMNEDSSDFRALRHGEKWRMLTGDNLIFYLAVELQEARVKLKKIKELLK